jgi:hypothetical protein
MVADIDQLPGGEAAAIVIRGDDLMIARRQRTTIRPIADIDVMIVLLVFLGRCEAIIHSCFLRLSCGRYWLQNSSRPKRYSYADEITIQIAVA